MHSVLIIDDDTELGEMLTEYLSPEGFSVTVAHTGNDGARLGQDGGWGAIILDVMLPGINGFEVLKRIRHHSMVPVIMLTAKGDDIDRILGLEMGADDYLPKPFNPRELVARLRAILRRHSSANDREVSAESLRCRDLTLWPGTRKAFYRDQPLALTSTEFNVLEVLTRHAGTLVTKETLYEQALGRPLSAYDRSIDMHISHLRRKFGDIDDRIVIHTIRGAGYQLEK